MSEFASKTLRFNIFGMLIAIVGVPGRWSAYISGDDGKRRPAEFIVPNELAEEELCGYLADLMHESATPSNNEAYRIHESRTV
ncbi:MAG: hypothetical protein KJ795_06715 [Gammaproteobacteria bacterium]|nr:hypothetical protein [Gammaproteobacteria bacterium]MBU1775162.1 hypothetical protein [Gammaproteobacteria bacterium]MBU1969674.1 hypothetical protein [Gammaproteobacteria bacterium]